MMQWRYQIPQDPLNFLCLAPGWAFEFRMLPLPKFLEMVYHVIGLMSGSSLDGLDIVKVELTEIGGQWTYEIQAADCIPYSEEWIGKLKTATSYNALDYMKLHTAYGHYIGQQVNAFIAKHQLEHKVHFIASHGHTVFHAPEAKMTAQLGDGASIAAETNLPVITDLRSMDIALGGQGAPIVPIGEKWLMPGYDFWLNLGGIANISSIIGKDYVAFDICAANRVLNTLANALGKDYDDGGQLASGGIVDAGLLGRLNSDPYFSKPYPKSLDNSFGIEVMLPLLQGSSLSVQTKLRTVVQHIAEQITAAVQMLISNNANQSTNKMLVTGGGAHNRFLLEVMDEMLSPLGIDIIVPDEMTINYKEALVMALMGTLRWREEVNVLHSVTGASRDSINGALWLA